MKVISKDQLIFLLGGHDLEMMEIKSILEQNHFNYYDLDLRWGAKLNEYQKFFNNKNTFIGIELINDCDPPFHYVEIDHHNEKSNLPSSIEQVAKLLNLELNRWQSLVAANDKFYIPGLVKMNATANEIAQIRQLDRFHQGVTDEDEKLGKKSICENLVKEGNLTIIKSLTSKFSTITDRLYPFNKLLIYHENSLTYYGEGVLKLIKYYEVWLRNKKAYSGGGENGFFGINRENIGSPEIIKNEVKRIKSLIHDEY
jgi:hypothetical protein